MEWVETTGKTVEDAKDAALDQLGVDEQDAEFEVLEEPRAGLFGRTRGEARVRARVRPQQPRPKVERRERRGRGRGADRGRTSRSDRSAKAKAPAGQERRAPAEAATDEPGTSVATESSQPDTDRGTAGSGSGSGASPRRRRRGGSSSNDRGDRPRPAADHDEEQETIPMSDTELAEQGEVVRAFLVDLVDAFGLDGEVTATPAEDDAVELAVDGPDLGLLIGPKGATLQAVQELSRSVLQRTLPGEHHARIRVDVGGYRARRREALEAFVRKVAADVLESGTQKALEPMSPPDRKVVHDTVNEIEGVHTVSEGEDARRRVVIIPDA
jgi:spoIIIJ-associated protein